MGGEDEDEEGRGGKRQRRGRGGAAGDSAVAMVKRDLLVRCLTCPLCDRLLRKATTISECLHTCEAIPALPCLACSAAPPIPAGSNACVSTMVPCVSLSVARDGDWIRRASASALGLAAPDLVARGCGDVGRRRRARPFPVTRRRCTAFSSAPMRDCDSRRACVRSGPCYSFAPSSLDST